MEALHAELQGYFEADKNFSHGWSRNPIYDGDNLGAYRWYAQHHEVLAGIEDDDLNDALAAVDPDVIDGVRVIWQSPGRAQRDVTAFQHALKTAGKLHRVGKKMTDDAIIDAYRQAYEVAQSVGADGRTREEPPMKDLRSLARRVRGYVSSNKRPHPGATKEYPTASTSMRSSERKFRVFLGAGLLDGDVHLFLFCA